MIHATAEEPFFTPCCGVQITGDIVPGETLCPYCEQELPLTCDVCGVAETEEDIIEFPDLGCFCLDCCGVND